MKLFLRSFFLRKVLRSATILLFTIPANALPIQKFKLPSRFFIDIYTDQVPGADINFA